MSGTSQKWEGRWDQLKGKVKSKWGAMTDDDWTRVEGDYEAMIGRLKERTGKSREELEAELDQE